MRSVIFVLLSAIFLIACSNSEIKQSEYKELIPVHKNGSVNNEDTLDADKKASNSTNTAKTTASESYSTSPDNLRGFDPASEDDMDDNGMSRYFENNDEEGWD